MPTKIKTEEVRLGAIRETRSLSPREHLSDEAIKEYVRKLQNGETPPPIQLEPKTNEIFAGRHRFHAYKAFYGEGWQDKTVPVAWRKDVPNPDENPAQFKVDAAAENRDNGVPITRVEKRRCLVALAKERGMEIALEYAAVMNETPESLEEMMRPFLAASEARLEAMAATEPPAAEGEAEVAPTPRGRADKRRPEAVHMSEMQSVRPVVMVACDKLSAALAQIKGDLTEAELLKLKHVDEQLHALIDR